MFIITPGFWEVPAACKQSLRPHLKVYDDSKDEHCGDQVHEVGQVLSVEGFPQRSHFVRASGQKMEESDDGSLEFCAWDREKFSARTAVTSFPVQLSVCYLFLC